MNRETFEAMAHQAVGMKPWPDDRFPPSRYYRFLRLLTGALQPQVSVELGVCGGGASFHMALGWPGGTVVGIDNGKPDALMADNWRYIKGRCPNWKFLAMDSIEAAPAVAAEHGQVGLLFIDTIHTLERTVMELTAWTPFLATECVVCFDDLFRQEMHGFWEWLDWDKVRLDHLHDGAYVDPETGFGGGGFGVAWRS